MGKRLTREEWHKRKKLKSIAMMGTTVLLMLVILAFSIFFIRDIIYSNFVSNNEGKVEIEKILDNGVVIQNRFLTPNPYSRPQTQLKRINGIVIHYTANPGTTADNNRSYFEGLATKKTTSASSHYIIGLEGEVLQCIPLTEIAYASNERNGDTIAIESCHMDETGVFNAATYDTMISLTAALCVEFDLKKKDILRHYDITGKLCPLYFVEHEDAWDLFRADVMLEVERIKKNAEQ